LKIRAIIDTNVWISAFINRRGFPAKLKNHFINSKFESIISIPLIKEISEVMRRPRIQDKYKIKDSEINQFIEILTATSIKIELKNNIHICRDKKDNFVLETAINGKANYIVTRDDDIKRDTDLIKHLKKHDIIILTVSRFLKILKKIK
jgi:putative PIN family toxin of toxin-antitoxin system